MLFAVTALAASSPLALPAWGAPVTAPGAIRPSSAPGPYVAGRARVLLGQADVVTRDGLDSCIK